MMSKKNSQALSRVYAWFSAIQADDTPLLTDLLAHGVPIDTLHPLRHSTALMEATRLGRTHLVRWLIEQGAAPAFLSGLPKRTALHCALRRHSWDLAELLAHHMQSCAVTDTYGATPLHTLCAEAASCNEDSILIKLTTLFMEKSCPMDAIDHEGTTALHHAVLNDSRPLAGALLRFGANPDALIPDSNVSPLTIAALEKNLPMAQLLMHFGANPNLRTREGASAISIYPAIAPIIKVNPIPRDDMRHAEFRMH